jgi:hypothetical protein
LWQLRVRHRTRGRHRGYSAETAPARDHLDLHAPTASA